MNIKDLTRDDWKTIMWTILFFCTFNIMFPISTNICDKLNIPYDLMLSVSSIGFRLELNITLSILYLVSLYQLTKFLAIIMINNS